MNKETSSRVSTIAAVIMNVDQPLPMVERSPGRFCQHASMQTLAGSCMSQDETAGQAPETFIDR
jgi:hypothetical protein